MIVRKQTIWQKIQYMPFDWYLEICTMDFMNEDWGHYAWPFGVALNIMMFFTRYPKSGRGTHFDFGRTDKAAKYGYHKRLTSQTSFASWQKYLYVALVVAQLTITYKFFFGHRVYYLRDHNALYKWDNTLFVRLIFCIFSPIHVVSSDIFTLCCVTGLMVLLIEKYDNKLHDTQRVYEELSRQTQRPTRVEQDVSCDTRTGHVAMYPHHSTQYGQLFATRIDGHNVLTKYDDNAGGFRPLRDTRVRTFIKKNVYGLRSTTSVRRAPSIRSDYLSRSGSGSSSPGKWFFSR